ncbi:MAG: sigma-70 family RNA polymerase sigma factor [Verrucomicrobia bacterium]|nr:sigma-70 family RNA polymerase sigma factor [Verrucomicrobiota bacterium]
MIEDSELLRRYAQDRSEAAFSELVRRRVNLVYSVALRQCGGDAHFAEDVTQKVFADLARKAASLAGRPVLSGWLYRSAQFAASDMVRTERRRRAREQETLIMNETVANFGEGAADWEKFRPVLDEAMGELNDEDRDAVALRYFEERPFAEVGRALSLTEDTARKRVERALDKLHAALSRRGVTSTTAALGLALANQAAVAAPAGLAASVTGAALAASGAGAAGWAIFGMTVAGKAAWGAVAASAVLATGAAVYETKRATEAEAALAGVVEQKASLQAKLRVTERRLQTEAKRAQAAEEDNALLLTAVQTQVRAMAAAGGGAGATGRGAMPAAVEKNAAATAKAGPITQESMEARYRAAQQLARSGDQVTALAEFLWCYDVGMVQVPSYVGVRSSFLLSEIGRLAKTYPPALAALQERRDQAEGKMMADATAVRAAADFAALNATLGEEQRTLAVFDQLAPGDARRRGLMVRLYDQLVVAQRYREAADGRTYAQMYSQFDYARQERPLPPTIRDPEGLRRSNREYAIRSTARDIEVLAGSGDLANARTLVEQVLAWDRSATTTTQLRTHLERAGHPELLAGR